VCARARVQACMWCIVSEDRGRMLLSYY